MNGPLDLMTPARHIATEIERAAPVALSISELAATYRHPNTGDVSRAKARSGAPDEAGANVWLIEQAMSKLMRRGERGKVQIVAEDGGYRFADGVTFDDVWFGGKKLQRRHNPHKVLRDPFDKMTGPFSDDVRAAGRSGSREKNLDELRESIREHGWIDDPIFYAIKDERGTVLVGHRRLRVAEELGQDVHGRRIEPRVRVVRCGEGDEADIRRFQLAVLSNMGRAEMTKPERQNIVAVLAGPDHDWTQMSIAKALGVSQRQISSDMRELEDRGQLEAPSNSKPRRGRPRKEPVPKKDNPDLHNAISDEWDKQGGPPTFPEIVAAAERIGLDIGKDTALKARDIVRARIETRAQSNQAQDIPTSADVDAPHLCTCPQCGNIHGRGT